MESLSYLLVVLDDGDNFALASRANATRFGVYTGRPRSGIIPLALD